MANTIEQGNDLMIFIKKSGDTTPTAIACATNHTLTVSTETSDTSHKDIVGKWKSSAVKSFSWEISTENLFTLDGTGNDYADLFDAMVAGTELTVAFGLKSGSTVPSTGWTMDSAKDSYTGNVIITSLTLNAPNGDNATYSATFTGVGQLTHTAV